MMRSVPYLAVFAISMEWISMSAHADTPAAERIDNAISDSRRPAEQVALDAARKPGQLLEFSQLKSADQVADFMPGNGYFTRLMSDVVGAHGRVYAFPAARSRRNPSLGTQRRIRERVGAARLNPSFPHAAAARCHLDRAELPRPA